MIATCSDDCTIKLWTVDKLLIENTEDEIINELEQIADESLDRNETNEKFRLKKEYNYFE